MKFNSRPKSAEKDSAKDEQTSLVQESASFERDRELELNKSRTIAWRIAGLAVMLAAVFGVALVTRELKYEPVAFLVRWRSLDGRGGGR